jgi:glycosyltransferase involved in cell wall biosynthesis
MPVYNAQRFLRVTLDSLHIQTMKDFEIIAINDGSTDGSLDILNEYAAADPRLKIITKKNGGVNAARNDGIKIAKGDYIHFMDADDFIDADYYEKMLARAQDTGADMACSGFIADSDFTTGIKYKKDFIARSLWDKFAKTYALTDGYSWRYLYRREFLTRNKLIFPVDMRSGGDAVFLLRTIRDANFIAFVSGVNYHYVFNDSSILNNRNNCPEYKAKTKANHKIAKDIKTKFARDHGILFLWKTRKIRRWLCPKFQ